MFLYIDFFLPRDTKKGIVLLAIGVYATSILFVKVLLAIVHHFKWLLFEKCCRKMKKDKFRIDRLRAFWEDSFRTYHRIVQENS